MIRNLEIYDDSGGRYVTAWSILKLLSRTMNNSQVKLEDWIPSFRFISPRARREFIWSLIECGNRAFILQRVRSGKEEINFLLPTPKGVLARSHPSLVQIGNRKRTFIVLSWTMLSTEERKHESQIYYSARITWKPKTIVWKFPLEAKSSWRICSSLKEI